MKIFHKRKTIKDAIKDTIRNAISSAADHLFQFHHSHIGTLYEVIGGLVLIVVLLITVLCYSCRGEPEIARDETSESTDAVKVEPVKVGTSKVEASKVSAPKVETPQLQIPPPPPEPCPPVIQSAYECTVNCFEKERKLDVVFDDLRKPSTEEFAISFQDRVGTNEQSRTYLKEACRELRMNGNVTLSQCDTYHEAIDEYMETLKVAPQKYNEAADWFEAKAIQVEYESTRSNYANVAKWWRSAATVAEMKLKRMPMNRQQIDASMAFVKESIGFLTDLEFSLDALPKSGGFDKVNQFLMQLQSFAVSYSAISLEIRRFENRMQAEINIIEGVDANVTDGNKKPTEEIKPLVIYAVHGSCGIFLISDNATIIPGDIVHLEDNEGLTSDYSVMNITGDIATVQSLHGDHPQKGNHVMLSDRKTTPETKPEPVKELVPGSEFDSTRIEEDEDLSTADTEEQKPEAAEAVPVEDQLD